MGQKIPLFGGVIAPIPVPFGPEAFFTPPDKSSDVPGTYEVHLYMCPEPLVAVKVVAYEGTKVAEAKRIAEVYAIEAEADRSPVVKLLDGYVVRGDVTLALQTVNKNGGASISVWGYYYRTGRGPVVESERRAIGQALQDHNAGVPFEIAKESSAIIHTFEPGRIDEMSLAFWGDREADIRVGFEDKNNNELAYGIFQPRSQSLFPLVPPGGGGTPAVVLPPLGSFFPPSPYTIYQCPFGGSPDFPTLDHLRVTNTDDGTALNVHGYFTRR